MCHLEEEGLRGEREERGGGGVINVRNSSWERAAKWAATRGEEGGRRGRGVNELPYLNVRKSSGYLGALHVSMFSDQQI